jgi:hypothetical protein
VNKKLQGILLGALAVQVVLAFVTWTSGGRQAHVDPKPLLGFDKAAVTAVEITEKASSPTDKDATLRLEKSGEGWVVASAGGYPAKKDKVEEFVAKLTDLKVRDPIATKKADHNALRVGADVWGRKVKITAGAETKELVVGSGQGSTVHVRFADKDDVYNGRGVSEYAISARASSYVDTDYVKVDADKVSEVEITNPAGTLSFRKDGENWSLAQLPAGQQLDQGKVKSFVSGIARLSFKEPVGKTIAPEYGLGAGAAKVVLRYTDGSDAKTVTYAVGAAKDGAHYVKADGQDFVVLVAEWSTKPVLEKKPDDFVKKEEPAAAANGAPRGLPPGMPAGLAMPPPDGEN